MGLDGGLRTEIIQIGREIEKAKKILFQIKNGQICPFFIILNLHILCYMLFESFLFFVRYLNF